MELLDMVIVLSTLVAAPRIMGGVWLIVLAVVILAGGK